MESSNEFDGEVHYREIGGEKVFSRIVDKVDYRYQGEKEQDNTS
jgi:hypothetical protein